MNEGRYPVGIQSFRELRSRGCIYIDKTALVYRMANTHKFYFLSRPRRFGKSLLVSTLEAYFNGDKTLFDGLDLQRLQPGEWPDYPVIHIDFSRMSYNLKGNLESFLNAVLSQYESLYGKIDYENAPELRFGGIIDRAYQQTGKQVVVLIDEYDLPIINNIANPDLEKWNQDILKGFYGVLKSKDEKLRFVLLTGVGKLGQLSVFSGLNNLVDISLMPRYATICGISESELHQYLDEGVREFADIHGWSVEKTYQRLNSQYDGYHFAENLVDVYNPFSLLSCLSSEKISDYWFQSGTPSHLLEALKKSDTDLSALNGITIAASSLVSADVIRHNPAPFMFYTGYLTIKAYNEKYGEYTLGYPNEEVKNGFIQSLLPMVTSLKDTETTSFVTTLARQIEHDDIEGFLQTMKVFFAKIPYDLESRNEYFYQNVMYCVAMLVGCYVKAEYHTSRGRIDMVLATGTTIYVMEFKLDRSPEEALLQIDRNDYTLGFSLDGRKIVKVAADFSSKTRTLSGWLIESGEESL